MLKTESAASVTLSASPLISLAVLPEDIIVAEFLLRLPIKPLFRFKCVSNRYESIISNPEFANIYLQRAHSSPELWPSSGLLAAFLFPLTPTYLHCLSKNVKDLTVTHNHDDQLPISVCSVSIPNNEQHEIQSFSNGLMLSVIHRPPRSRPEKCGTFLLRVSNPLTKKCVPIPGSTTLTDYMDTVYCISTRSACYKIVLIQYMNNGTFLEDNTNATVDIFSSDTGSWASWEVRGFPVDFSYSGTVQANFAHRGVLHWLGHTTGMVITYDPYNNHPDQFGRIRLPNQKYSSLCYGSLIYSGDEEMVKYCEMDKGGSDVFRVKVWGLVDSEKGEWCNEGEFSFPSLPRLCEGLLFGLNPCNRDVVCHPYVIDKSVMVINLCTGSWKLVNVVDANAAEPVLCFVGNFYKCWPLIPLESSPWSSPFYEKKIHKNEKLVMHNFWLFAPSEDSAPYQNKRGFV